MKKFDYLLKINEISCNKCVKEIQGVLLSFGLSDYKIYHGFNRIYINGVQRNKLEKIIRELESLGFKVLSRKKNQFNYLFFFNILIFIGLIMLLFFGYLFGKSFDLSQNVPFVLLLVFGLLNGTHCISMCSPLVFLAIDDGKKKVRKLSLYTSGRLISYSLMGALLGGFGSLFQISKTISGFFSILMGILLIVFAMNYVGLINLSFLGGLRGFKKIKNPFFIGFSNVLVPCGILGAVEIYAIGTGSFINGLLALLFFAIGTSIPLILAGIFKGYINIKNTFLLKVLILVIMGTLSIRMINIGITTIELSNRTNTAVSIDVKQDEVKGNSSARVKDDPKEIIENPLKEITLTIDGGYNVSGLEALKDVEIGEEIYVKFNLVEVTSCNQAFTIYSPSKEGTDYYVDLNKNPKGIVIKVEEKGQYQIVCYMAMQFAKFTI